MIFPLNTLTVSTVSRMFPRMLLLSALAVSVAGTASADGTFLLQLGSYDSQSQATRKWDDVKSKNADIVGSLSLHVAEVAVPPNDSVAYRTQAGPLPTRDQASALCDQLQSRSVDCSVVETAMFTANQPATQAIPPTLEAASSAAAEPSVETPPGISAPPLADTATQVTPPAPPASTPIASIPVAPTPVAPAPVAQSAAAPAPAAVPPSHIVPGREPRALGADTAAAVTPPAPVATPPAPVEVPAAPVANDAVPPPPEAKPGFLDRMFGSSSKPAASSPAGQVEVAEAVRVPLGSGQSQTGMKMVPGLPAVHGLGGLPSQNTARTWWAQLSYFSDEMAARNFYESFRATYPQLSDGVRVRISRPYQSSAGHVSLRVGPFAGTQDVAIICRAASLSGARCGIVRDLGGAADTAPRHRISYRLNSSEHEGLSGDAPRMVFAAYWVQLGSFRSEDEAYDQWKSLQEENNKLFRHIHANVKAPAMSSSLRPVYRLRTGPFPTQSAANALCGDLRAHGVGCLVLADR